MKKVLLLGASGFVGSNVLEYMLDKTDWEFTCLCSWRHRGNPLNIRPDKRVNIVSHDLTAPFPDMGAFDYILNLASSSHVDRSIKYPLPFIENNVSSALQVLEYARKYPPEVLLLFSTDEVYGALQHEDWDVLLPSNPYAASKAMQEMMHIAYWKTYRIPVVITNSNNIVGKNQHKEKFVPKIVEQIKRDETVEIHTSQGKPGKRYWNPVDNISDALLFILKQPLARYSNTADRQVDRPSRYSLSGGTELNNLEMAQLIAKLLGKKLQYRLVDAETVRPGYDEFYASNNELEKFGWKPPKTLEEGLLWIR